MSFEITGYCLDFYPAILSKRETLRDDAFLTRQFIDCIPSPLLVSTYGTATPSSIIVSVARDDPYYRQLLYE